MCRCKLAVSIILLLGSVAHAATEETLAVEDTAQVREIAAEKSATKKLFPVASQFEVGLSYVQWNERMGLSRGATSGRGYANYAGPGLSLEYNRRGQRWQYGVTATLAAGKAAAGGFGSGLTFADGVDRSWTGAFLHPFVHYRANPTFMIGLGALARMRTVDWGSLDPTLSVDPHSSFAGAPTMDLRWTLADTITLVQSFALLGLEGETQWTWSAQTVF